MSAQAPPAYITPEEYLALEREAEYKSEYFDGEIFAMAGASEAHNLISGNFFAERAIQEASLQGVQQYARQGEPNGLIHISRYCCSVR